MTICITSSHPRNRTGTGFCVAHSRVSSLIRYIIIYPTVDMNSALSYRPLGSAESSFVELSAAVHRPAAHYDEWPGISAARASASYGWLSVMRQGGEKKITYWGAMTFRFSREGTASGGRRSAKMHTAIGATLLETPHGNPDAHGLRNR